MATVSGLPGSLARPADDVTRREGRAALHPDFPGTRLTQAGQLEHRSDEDYFPRVIRLMDLAAIRAGRFW